MVLISPQDRAKFEKMVYALSLWVAVVFKVAAAGNPPLPVEPLTVETASGATHRFKVEVAATSQAIRNGMMFRTSAPPGTGMFFDLGMERRGVWVYMKNTLIPLDIIYLDDRGKIVRIVRGKPLDETKKFAGVPIRAVLEIASGTAEKLKIRTGDRVRHRIFGDTLPSILSGEQGSVPNKTP